MQEAQRTPSIRNMKKTAPRCLTIRCSKQALERSFFKASKGKGHAIYRGTNLMIKAELFLETVHVEDSETAS